MTNTQEIIVEQRHIDAGDRKCACHCPVALAIRETTGLEPNVGPGRLVLYSIAHFNVLDKAHDEYQDGWRVSEFITQFDRGAQVFPFSFQIPVPARNTIPTSGETK